MIQLVETRTLKGSGLMPERIKLDFQAIKDAVTLEAVINLLQLPVKKSNGQYRCECPVHEGNSRGLAITPGRGFYCFAEKKGGDQISLYAHVKQLSNYDAAAELDKRFRVAKRLPTLSEPQVNICKPVSQNGLQPLTYLEPQHEVLELLGLSSAVCDALGIGFAPKGTVAGRIAFPLRLPSGELVGYMSLATKPDQQPLLKFPNNLEELCGSAPQAEQEDEPEKCSADDMRKLLRVV
jgi:DNA primase